MAMSLCATLHCCAFGCHLPWPCPWVPPPIGMLLGAISCGHTIGCHLPLPCPWVPPPMAMPLSAISHCRAVGCHLPWPCPWVPYHVCALGCLLPLPCPWVPPPVAKPLGATSHGHALGCLLLWPRCWVPPPAALPPDAAPRLAPLTPLLLSRHRRVQRLAPIAAPPLQLHLPLPAAPAAGAAPLHG